MIHNVVAFNRRDHCYSINPFSSKIYYKVTLHCVSRACYHKGVRSVTKNSDRRIRTDIRTRDPFKEGRNIKGRYDIIQSMEV